MNVRDQQALKWSTLWLILCDFIIVIIAVWLFWDSGKGTSAVAYFVVIVATIAFYAIKVLYYVQCWDQEKRMAHVWNRQIEWIPVFFMVLNVLIVQFLFFIFILYKNNISITEAFSKLNIDGWWLLIILVITVSFILFFSIRSCYIHRHNSVTICTTIEEVTTCHLPPHKIPNFNSQKSNPNGSQVY